MRFLVAEDEPGSRLMLVHFLKPYATIDEAPDGQDAVDLFEKALKAGERYDLVFLDIMMPRKSGQEVLTAIRDLEVEHGILADQGARVVMTTALDDDENVFDAHVSGISAYLVKPIRRELLYSELERLGYEKSEPSA